MKIFLKSVSLFLLPGIVQGFWNYSGWKKNCPISEDLSKKSRFYKAIGSTSKPQYRPFLDRHLSTTSIILRTKEVLQTPRPTINPFLRPSSTVKNANFSGGDDLQEIRVRNQSGSQVNDELEKSPFRYGFNFRYSINRRTRTFTINQFKGWSHAKNTSIYLVLSNVQKEAPAEL